MGPVQLYIGASLDGYIADPAGGVGWLERFLSPGEDYGYGAFLAGVGAVVMGATTYRQELARGGWPYGDRPTWVFSHRERQRPSEGRVHVIAAPVTEVLEHIDRATEGNVFLVGGADLARQFIAAGALDELILSVVPVALGAGIALFSGAGRFSARLLSTRSFDSGLVQLHYRLPGDGEAVSPG